MDLHPIGTAENISSNITKAIVSIDEYLQDGEKRSQLAVTDYDGMLVYSFKDKKVNPLGTALKTELESHGYNVHGVLIAHAYKPGTLRNSTKKLLIYPRQRLKVIPANDPSTTDRNRPAREPYDLHPGYQAYEVSEPRIIPPPSDDGTGKAGADVICVVLK